MKTFDEWWAALVERNRRLGEPEPVRLRSRKVEEIARQAWELGREEGRRAEARVRDLFGGVFGGR